MDYLSFPAYEARSERERARELALHFQLSDVMDRLDRALEDWHGQDSRKKALEALAKDPMMSSRSLKARFGLNDVTVKQLREEVMRPYECT